MNLIEFQHVTFGYNPENPILLDFNQSIKKNCWTVIFGETGSGKTTIIKLIYDLIRPQAGKIIKHFTRVELPGWLMQNPDDQITQVTVEKELAFPLENRGLPVTEIHERVEQYLDLFNLREQRDRPTFILSGGEKQRLALASLLIANQKSIILDEPVSFLDVESKLKFIHLLRSLQDLTVIWFTSEKEECKLADCLIKL